MSFTDTQMPGILIAEIFKTSLVQAIHQPEQPLSNNTPCQLPGAQFNNTVLIVVSYEANGDIPADQYNFLSSVLNACQLNIRDATIINSATASVRFGDLRAANPKTILLFNIDASLLQHTQEPASLEVTFLDGIPVLSAPDLREFTTGSAQSRLLKSKLWAGLKQIFNI